MLDQQRFADLSGDRNPIHVDERAARMTVAGACVVHGVHLALWVLETLGRDFDLQALCAVNAKFMKFAAVDQELALTMGSIKGGSRKIDIVANGQSLASFTLKSGDIGMRDRARLTTAPARPTPDSPDDPSETEMAGLEGRFTRPAAVRACEAAFPNASRSLGVNRLVGLALLSSVVGMVCPGRHSIFSQFQAAFIDADADDADVDIRARAHDSRFRLVSLAFAGAGLKGEVSAYHRFPPVEASLETIAAMVKPREFAERRALIIGGSRGLGAATAKLIAAGGGRVTLTYARNLDKAVEIQRELCGRYGADSCQVLELDVANVGESGLLATSLDYSHLYYFATPTIAQNSATILNYVDFAHFSEFYIKGFFEVVSALTASGKPLSVLYPSTVYVDKRPKGMTAYAMAKAAGEVLCRDIERTLPWVTVRTPRLPRVLTDQTATVPPVPAPEAAEVMLPILRGEGTGEA